MAKFNSFEEIIAWQKARELNIKIYSITNHSDFAKASIEEDKIAIISIS